MTRIDTPRKKASLTTLLLTALTVAACSAPPPPPAGAERFVKFDDSGQALPATTGQTHSCVLDRRTGLVWEVGHPGDQGHTYSWYSADKRIHMSEPGQANGGDCPLDRCDTQARREAVNGAGLCGQRDWRMPSRDEVLTLTARAPSGNPHVLDPDFFPDAVAGEYWTGETFRLYPRSAWAFDTRTGLDRTDWKTVAKPVRLVRGTFQRGKRRDR